MGIQRPSQHVMEAARRLGMQMAMIEPGFSPDVSGAEQYVSYTQFLLFHRKAMETYPRFARWDREIEQLVESQEPRADADRKLWDNFITHVAEPIRASFWFGWESAVELHRLYDQHMARVRNKPAVGVLHVAHREYEHDRRDTDQPEVTPSCSGLLDLTCADQLDIRLEDIISTLEPPRP